MLGLLAVSFLLLAACAEDDPTVGETGGALTGATGDSATGATAAATAAECAAGSEIPYQTAGTLTIGTDNPVFQPWFAGTGDYGEWEAQPNQGTGNPASGEGFESAFAYALAAELGFAAEDVVWEPLNFNESYRPGPKDYDFYIGQVSYTPERAEAVTYSAPYFDVNQALVANEGTPIAEATSLADLQPYLLGVQIGTTSHTYVVENIQPEQEPRVFDRSVDVIQALNNGQIDGYVVDAPTGYVNVLIGQAENGVVVGQFPSEGEYFGAIFETGNPLVDCVNLGIEALEADGTLPALQEEWLADITYPVLQ
ncbi:MAG TPA: ABC transporter substrate-binding protein [Actinomycetota bacterium]